ncbi:MULTISPECIES: tail fiber protein [unclassified Leifsonia]|uniref:phage tail protein n=1 Tax=unclassified Leifsonia TaxID=2663824 RepID=UPI000A19B048|nr:MULTISPECIES: tail fiber protein [unclassified Leifsonia]QJA00169.1 phage tail protein [Leifsonia sp. PS1209]
MSTPYLGEIRLASFSFAPKNWAMCDGQFLPINQNQALFSLLGTTYGGNGQTNFRLPDLRGRVPVGFANDFPQGQAGGEYDHTLTASELGAHTHQAAVAVVPNTATPTGSQLAQPGKAAYAAAPTATMAPIAVSQVGGGLAHTNTAPYLTVNFLIALVGIFPTPN